MIEEGELSPVEAVYHPLQNGRKDNITIIVIHV